MLMFHTDERPYAQAASDAARAMRSKLQNRITMGRRTGALAIDRIMNDVPSDKIVPGAVMSFEPTESGLAVHYGEVVEDVHAFALGQFAEHARVPRSYLTHLHEQGTWGRELAAENLTRIFARDPQRHLIRSVGAQTRACLSTRYRRLHPGVLLESFQRACEAVGAVPYEAICTDTKWMVKAVLQEVIEPVRDEVLALGVVIHESAFGNGATEVAPFVERMWCTNQAVCSTELRRVHLGGRLDASIEWSDETMLADTKALSHQVGDLVRGQLGSGAIAKVVRAVREANELQIDPKTFESFLKKHLGRDEADKVTAVFTSADILNLPPGSSAWRASNALSWFAHSIEEPERRFDIQRLAGAMLAGPRGRT